MFNIFYCHIKNFSPLHPSNPLLQKLLQLLRELHSRGIKLAVASNKFQSGTEYLVAVNRSPEKELTLKIALAPGAKRIRTDGTLVDAALYSGEYWLEPGAMEVFQAP